MTHITTIVPPATGLVDLAAAKVHLRVDHDADDSLIVGQIAAVSSWLTTFVGKSLITASYLLEDSGFPAAGMPYRLLRPPVTTVQSVEYLDPDYQIQTIDPSRYEVLQGKWLALTDQNEHWPDTARRFDAVRVAYTAGYGTIADLPGEITPAALLLLGVLYEERAEEFSGMNLQHLEFSAGQLVGNLREAIL